MVSRQVLCVCANESRMPVKCGGYYKALRPLQVNFKYQYNLTKPGGVGVKFAGVMCGKRPLMYGKRLFSIIFPLRLSMLIQDL